MFLVWLAETTEDERTTWTCLQYKTGGQVSSVLYIEAWTNQFDSGCTKIPTLLGHLNATGDEYSTRFVGGGGLDKMTSKIIYILTYFEAFILCLHFVQLPTCHSVYTQSKDIHDVHDTSSYAWHSKQSVHPQCWVIKLTHGFCLKLI